MDISTFDAALDKLPRHRVGFYPTPFHALPNLSRTLGVNLYLKREDLAGPSAISGSKTRLAEFILGRALERGVSHLITQGAYLTNSGLQYRGRVPERPHHADPGADPQRPPARSAR